jgi:hypothetical protein
MTYTLIEDLPENVDESYNIEEKYQGIPVEEGNNYHDYSNYSQNNIQPEFENKGLNKYVLPHNSPSCIDVANHIELCPICSRHYNSDMKYIVIIILLTIVCLLMLKKILNL